ncbi:MAG: phage antirepressor Ant [Clostridium neonatale]
MINELVLQNGRIKSVDLVDIINTFRKEEGKTDLRHDSFIAKIRKELETLNALGLGADQNFLEGKYLDKNNQERPCFELTRDGTVEMLNSESAYCRYKTVEYINKLQEKIKNPQKPTCIEDVLISSLQEMKAMRQEVQAIKQANTENQEAIQGIRDVVAINTSTMSWREDCRKIIVKIAHKLGGNSFIGDVNREVYDLMRTRLKVRLDVKLTNLRRRMADEGVCVSKRNSMNYLDVIKDDARLVEGYVSIVKELAVKYGVGIKED